MKKPEGLQHFEKINDATCLQLVKSLYGLVQAARVWWKAFAGYLSNELGFIKSIIDPCLLYKKDTNGTVYLCLYVNDLLCVGDRPAINKAISGIKKRLTIKQMGHMNEYVGCKVIPTDENSLFIIQPDLINKMEKTFKELLNGGIVYSTPAGPGLTVIRETVKGSEISELEQRIYRSGVGVLLYLIKHSRPDISNATRELAKVMDGAGEAHLKMLFCTIKYVVDTKNRALYMKSNNFNCEKVIIKGVSDSDYAGDNDMRRSVRGYVVYINGLLISWKSRGQKSVKLSSNEAEYVALSEMCTELVFLKMVIESIGVQVELPMKVYVDNGGAIFLTNNTSTGQRTKHIDIRYHYARELASDGIIEVIFVGTAENDADIYTQNTSSELYDKHTSKYMQSVEIDYH
jgi:Reverse transcriptase (RNA-dependent DNA polymerase)